MAATCSTGKPPHPDPAQPDFAEGTAVEVMGCIEDWRWCNGIAGDERGRD